MKAIILAGGEGTRLRPFTEAIPKPMLPIGSKPLLEIQIEYLKHFGFDEFILAIYYLEENFLHYFGEGERFGVNISYSTEKSLLGTAGAVKQASEGINETFLVTLGDGLADIDYNSLLKYHHDNNADATMVLYEERLIVPYGVLEIDETEGTILSLDEKPELYFKVNTGIVVLEPHTLGYVKKNESLNMPDLIARLIKNGHKTIAYTHKGNWVDIGQDIDQYLDTNQKILKNSMKFNQILSDIIFGGARK